jgi:hypothetical protein
MSGLWLAFWCVLAGSADASGAAGQLAAPATLPAAVRELTHQASQFWGSAPNWYCRETLRQRSAATPGRPRRIHFSLPAAPATEPASREIVSWYGFSGYGQNSEAIRELREIVSVDGKPLSRHPAPDGFLKVLLGRDDVAKQSLVETFRSTTIGDAPFDFGQLLMLFTRRSIERYTFTAAGQDLIGAERVVVYRYAQQTGSPGLHLDANTTIPLTGSVYLRNADSAPLRISVTAVRKDKTDIRDESQVDYEEVAHGVFLPASLVHRRFVNGKLFAEDRAQYAEWKPVRPGQ